MVAGVGQMCLTPGLIVAVDGDGFERLRNALRDAIDKQSSATMLSPNILDGYLRGVQRLRETGGVGELAHGAVADKPLDAQAYVFEIEANDVIADISSTDEVFGPSAMLIKCRSNQELLEIARRMRGQLSMVMQLDSGDLDLAKRLLPILGRRTGRIVANEFSNMVEISDAQIHGGPYPATSDTRFTAVGSNAVDRFLRPVAYQNLLAELLPPSLCDDNPLGLWRLRDKVPGMR
jgi:2,5-dioxopentanoate dehydrogenase